MQLILKSEISRNSLNTFYDLIKFKSSQLSRNIKDVKLYDWTWLCRSYHRFIKVLQKINQLITNKVFRYML